MSSDGCTLKDSALGVQLDRYRQLGTTAARVTRRDLALTVWFDASLDLELLGETIAIERGCCGFFTIDYDSSDRRLSISVDGPDRRGALDSLRVALTHHGSGSRDSA